VVVYTLIGYPAAPPFSDFDGMAYVDYTLSE
jgi:hypothetical protein